MVDPRAWILPIVAFGGLLAINVAISLLLYWNDRTPLYRLLASFWLGTVAGMLAQGVLPEPPGAIAAFGISSFFITLCLADFLRRTLSLHFHGRLYAVTAAAGAVSSLVACAFSAPFWAASLPVAIAVVVPLVDISRQALMGQCRLSVSARCMIGAVIAMTVNALDFPFVRTDARFIPYVLAISIVTMSAVSICAPLMILERTAAEVRRLQMEAIERERFSALGEASAVVAHEVRNPLATMTNTIELLRKEPISAEGHELLVIQRAEVLRLDRLVRDLLSFSKPLEPKLTEVDLGGMLRHAIRSLRADAAAAHVEFAVDDSGQHHVRGDPDSIHIALINVLRNAIEASPGGATVRATLTNGGAEVRVSIDDEGEGVAADAIDHVFKPFFTTRAQGSGLGLAILDRIMRAHGGHVRVSNLPGKGARFELVFSSSQPRGEPGGAC